ncbi:MAG: hypothetical protein US89_C0007G0023 [Candidatus Peregrinibacteria bacterium GW2011_GWF2_38_29]|nr:MAG: hypothetical protein US89_C0007G0023 [Candidatus Peregrinibacteria bacterium GW2011_GWF2_38_29]HBB02840.1 hypothetical protein [Candidatus Peregrinibacteria bacterium]
MKLIITDSIEKHELSALERVFSLSVIKVAAIKSLKGPGENIKNSISIPKTILRKIYITSSSGAGRAMFLLQIEAEKAILVIIRQKKDKQIGANMAVENPKFKKVLERNLDLIIRDLEVGKYKEYDLESQIAI